MAVLLRSDLSVLAATDAFLEATHQRRSEVVGHGLATVALHPIDATAVRELEDALRTALRDRVRVELPARHYRIGDGEYVVRCVLVPVGKTHRGATRLLLELDEGVSPSELTEVKRTEAKLHEALEELRVAQEELIHANSDLERRVAERTQALSASEGRARALAQANEQALELAQRANRAKDEFLAMLGHELRNPMAPIRTALEVLRLRGVSAPELDIIHRQVGHLVQLVDDLLDIARITRGKVALHKELIDVHDVVARGAEMVMPLIEENRHRLTIDVPRGELRVEGDAVRLAQVVSNLLNNAAKFTPPGGTIHVTASKTGDLALLQVKDSGAGIDPALLPHVFELFVQGERSERLHGGLGLGLALVSNLVRLHGGSVSATSSGPGTGSIFEVRLPLATAPTTAAQPPRREAPAVGAHRILVVDDNVDAAELLASGLRARGHEVVVANDAPQALHVIETFVPDVAVLDLGLPVMDGYELCARMRTYRALAGCQFIALSGYGQASDRTRALARGFSEHLVKPVTLDGLLRAIAAGEPAQRRTAPPQPVAH